MILSHEKVLHLAHRVLQGLKRTAGLSIAEEERAVQEIQRAIQEDLRLEEELDRDVRRKITSLARSPVDGSPEWDILYRKYFSELAARKRLA